MDYSAKVRRDIADLVPRFLINRRADVASMKAALRASDMQALNELGERMLGVGDPFGFLPITTFGRQVRAACVDANALAIGTVVAEYEKYLNNVKIVEVDPPSIRHRRGARREG
jgi:hypothetical protein